MRMILLSAAALALAGLASPSIASGSGASGSAGGFGSFSGSGNSAQNREIQRLFRQGRSQVRKHITCKECEYHKRLNKNNARQVAQEVIEGKFEMNESNRTAVLIYLRDRYDL